MLAMASGGAGEAWPGLSEARRQAAERGATSIGTQHVLFAVLAGNDDDALAALHAGGVEPGSAADALQTIAGIGSWHEAVDVDTVPVSDRVVHVLEAAAQDRADVRREVRDRDVLRALLSNDDPAVGHLVVRIVSAPERVVEELDRLAAQQSEDG